MAQSASSQTTYPSLKIYDGDTVVVVTLRQAQRINRDKARLRASGEMADSLRALLLTRKEIIFEQDSVLLSCKEETRLAEEMASLSDREAVKQRKAAGKQKKLKWLWAAIGAGLGYMIGK